MTIGTKIIKGALRKIQVHTLNSPASSEDIENSVDTLNSMLEMWTSKGIELGIIPLESSGNELGEPPDTTNAIKSNLAIYLADDYEDGQAIVSKTLRDNARRDFEDLQTIGYRNLNLAGKVPSDTLLTGQGNKRWWDSYRTFFGPGTTLGGDVGAAGLGGGGGGGGGGIPGPPGPPGPQGPPGDEVFATLAEAIAGVVDDKSIAPDTLHGTFASPPGIGTTVEAPIATIAGVIIEKTGTFSAIKPVSGQTLSIVGSGGNLTINSVEAGTTVNIQAVKWPLIEPSLGQVPQITDVFGSVNWENPHEILNLLGTGDLVFNSSTDILTRLGIGTLGQVLTVENGLPAWKISPTSHKNYIVGGDFVYQPEGDKSPIPDGEYSFPEWRYSVVGQAFSNSVTKSTNVPTFVQSGHQSVSSMEIKALNVIIPDTTAILNTEIVIPGDKFAEIDGQTVTFSFWAFITDIVSGYTIAMQNSARDRSRVHEINVSGSNTWTKIRFTVPLDTSGTWLTGADEVGLRIMIALTRPTEGGTKLTSTYDTWLAGDFRVGENQSNTNSAIDNVATFDQFAVYLGDVDPAFVSSEVSAVEAEIGRYFERLDYTDVFGQIIEFGLTNNSTNGDVWITYLYKKVKIPSIKFGSTTGSDYKFIDSALTNATGTSTIGAGDQTKRNFEINASWSPALAIGRIKMERNANAANIFFDINGRLT